MGNPLDELLNAPDPSQVAPLDGMPNVPQGPVSSAVPAPPQGGGVKSMLKGMLSNFLSGAGQAGAEYSGINEGQVKQAQARHLDAQTGLANKQASMMDQMVTIQTPNGPMQVPYKLAPAFINANAKVDAAKTNKRYLTTPAGLFDTQKLDASGMPTLIPNAGGAVTITQEMADQYQIPKDFVGKPVKLTDLAAMERGNAMQFGFTMGENGPVAANKVTGVANPVTVGGKAVGNPGVATAEARARAAAKYGVAITDSGETVSRLDALQHGLKLASSNPLIRPGLKGYEDAYYSDARMKQMQQQAQDQTGASDMALLFNHIAMTGGNVKGMSMGEHITAEHAKARSIPEDLVVLWNHAADGQKLSPQQRQNFLKLAVEVRNTTWQRAAQQGKAYGIDPTALEQDPELDPVDLSHYNARPRNQVPKAVRDKMNQSSASLPAVAANTLSEGHNTTFANGQTWTKKNGVATRVK